MEWKEIPDFFGYEINKTGEVRTKRGNKVKPYIDKQGYLVIKKTIQIKLHRALLLTFKPENNGMPCVRHLDDVKLNNSLDNLVWGSYLDNYNDALLNGKISPALAPSGEKSPHAKLTAENVKAIRTRALTEKKTIIHKDYQVVSYATLCRIVRREDWKHVL